jgi:SAM-dependent methyltransferase
VQELAATSGQDLARPAYDELAPFYDAFVGDRTAQTTYLLSLIGAHHAQARSILEFACGTGAILRLLPQRFALAGIDASQRMLELASQAAPDARLFCGDVTRFRTGDTYDVLLCVLDSINHLGTFQEWEAVFDRASEHLNPNGIFIFDMNTIHRLESLLNEQPITRNVGNSCRLRIDISRMPPPVSRAGATRWNVTLLHGAAKPAQERLLAQFDEVAFAVDDVERSLSERFSSVSLYDPERDQPTHQTRRLHFVCQR